MSLNEDYTAFVTSVTSAESKDHEAYIRRLNELHEMGVNISLLDTGASGRASEGGEFMEVVKKIKFQSKPPTEETIYHMKRELSDICWYLVNACTALGVSLDDVIRMNIEKLEARYPNGFEMARSEHRGADDL